MMIKVYMQLAYMEDQPAFKAGIKPGDHIIAIDGQSTTEIPVEEHPLEFVAKLVLPYL